MLSRQASSLYWIGRYQERAEYLTRYLQVKYFSMMDVSDIEFRDFSLRSIMFMASGQVYANPSIDEKELLSSITLSRESKVSIYFYLEQVRENTMGVRNLISNELWEIINRNYHYVNSFSQDHVVTRGLYEFTNGVLENSDSFHSRLENTLLHDEVWAFLNLGVYLERAYQITRILINTLIDIKAMAGTDDILTTENYHWLTALNTLEANDMSKRIFNSSLQQQNTCEFLITNLDFPRSISFTVNELNKLVRKIKRVSDVKNLTRGTIEFMTAKLSADLKYLDYPKVDTELDLYLNKVVTEIIQLNDMIHKDFFGN